MVEESFRKLLSYLVWFYIEYATRIGVKKRQSLVTMASCVNVTAGKEPNNAFAKNVCLIVNL